MILSLRPTKEGQIRVVVRQGGHPTWDGCVNSLDQITDLLTRADQVYLYKGYGICRQVFYPPLEKGQRWLHQLGQMVETERDAFNAE